MYKMQPIFVVLAGYIVQFVIDLLYNSIIIFTFIHKHIQYTGMLFYGSLMNTLPFRCSDLGCRTTNGQTKRLASGNSSHW